MRLRVAVPADGQRITQLVIKTSQPEGLFRQEQPQNRKKAMQNTCFHPLFASFQRTAAIAMTALLCTFGLSETHAQGQGQGRGQGRGLLSSDFTITPTINEISINDEGELVASGEVTAEIRGRTTTSTFSDVPVNLSLAEDQSEAGACPILDLELGPINLDLLGLIVETSPICLQITAYDGGGLLGDLLCEVAGLLGGGLSLDDLLGGVLSGDQLNQLLTGIEDLLNEALGNLLDSVVTDVTSVRGGGPACSILSLTLGPVDLTLLGLNVHLDDCEGGPVTVDITGERSGLLGRLLCQLLGGGGLGLGSTLQDIVDGILGRLNG